MKKETGAFMPILLRFLSKMHTLLDLRGSIPIFVDITEGAVHDVNALDKMPVEPGSYYVMDKGYVDFNRLYTRFHKCRAFYVTRAKDNIKYQAISSSEVDKTAGIISDQLVRLTGYKSSKYYPEEFRLVVYEDYATSVVYTFMTNDFDLPALTIAELYRERWKIELFQMDKAASSYQGILRYKSECSLLSNMDRNRHLLADRNCQEEAKSGNQSLHFRSNNGSNSF